MSEHPPARGGAAAAAPPPAALAHGLPLARLLDLAADAVQGVRSGRSLAALVADCPADARPGVLALASDALRRLGSALEARARLAPKTPPPNVDALLLVALALLWPEPAPAYPDHTLVDQAVVAARRRTPVATGFVNAVLRRFVRERERIVAEVGHTPLGAYNHPPWWIERVRHDWPQLWQPLLAAANERPPMVLRVNARRGSGAAYVQRLAAQGRRAVLLDEPGLAGQAVWLGEPCAVQQLPGFAEGEVSVQDSAAQRAAGLLLGAGLPAGARVLDACAAPGGKTAQLLERADLDLVALDVDPQRLALVRQTLNRLGLAAKLVAADARDVGRWWDRRPFDAILLDAPCTASGVGRRHPDVRWLRRPADIATLAAQQTELLESLWPLLRPGGRLLYATCSIFRAEGQEQIDAFLQRHAAEGVAADPGSPGHLLPLPDNRATGGSASHRAVVGDGFYYGLLHKP